MSTNFAALLGQNVEAAERPKPLPMGTYTFVVKKHEFGESTQKKTPFVAFTVSPLALGADVDQALLPPNWTAKEMTLNYYLTPDAMFRLREFLEHLGIKISGRTFADAIPETMNQQFQGSVIHETSTRDPNAVYANISSTAPAA